MLVKNTLEV